MHHTAVLISNISFVAGLETKYVVLIVGICLLVVAIVLGVAIFIFIRRWKKKNDLELLGYPPKVPPSRPNNGGMPTSSVKTIF